MNDETSTPSIGEATMDASGTITLLLRATSPGGPTGDALLLIPKGDPRYQATLQHLGGLQPGETKPVPPWPDA